MPYIFEDVSDFPFRVWHVWLTTVPLRALFSGTFVNRAHAPFQMSPKGTVSVIWSDPPYKNDNTQFSRVPLKALSESINYESDTWNWVVDWILYKTLILDIIIFRFGYWEKYPVTWKNTGEAGCNPADIQGAS